MLTGVARPGHSKWRHAGVRSHFASGHPLRKQPSFAQAHLDPTPFQFFMELFFWQYAEGRQWRHGPLRWWNMDCATSELLEEALASGQEDCTMDVPNDKWGGHVWHFDFRTGKQTRLDKDGAVMATKRIRRCKVMQLVGPPPPPPPDRRLVGPADAAGSGAGPPPPPPSASEWLLEEKPAGAAGSGADPAGL